MIFAVKICYLAALLLFIYLKLSAGNDFLEVGLIIYACLWMVITGWATVSIVLIVLQRNFSEKRLKSIESKLIRPATSLLYAVFLIGFLVFQQDDLFFNLSGLLGACFASRGLAFTGQ